MTVLPDLLAWMCFVNGFPPSKATSESVRIHDRGTFGHAHVDNRYLEAQDLSVGTILIC